MFGYITINKPELRIREYETYHAWYCGLCRALKDGYGRKGQLTLTYDMTFLVVLLSGLYEPKTEQGAARCVAHPTTKHGYLVNDISAYAADMNVLMAYYKSLDDWNDEHKIAKGALAKSLAGSVARIRQTYPEKVARIEEAMARLGQAEKDGSLNFDEMAGLFGQVMAELFLYREDEWRVVLYRCGFYLGKFIYLMDAYEDLEEDHEKGTFNPLFEREGQKDFDAWCGQILTMMMTESARAFEVLPIVQDAELLRNIIYAGVWNRYEQVQLRRSQNRGKDERSV